MPEPDRSPTRTLAQSFAASGNTNPPTAPDGPEVVKVRPWPDPVIDTLGHDPRSLYVETFWLPVLGPTCVLLLRLLARMFEDAGAGIGTMRPGPAADGDRPPLPPVFELPVVDTSHALGVGPRNGRGSPLVRGLERLAKFDLAYAHTDGTVAVRRAVPPASRRQVRRLPRALREEHDRWMRIEGAPRRIAERKARRAAFTLLELGADVDSAERSLHAVGFPPAVCREAATWACTRHRAAERQAALHAQTPQGIDSADQPVAAGAETVSRPAGEAA